MKNTTDYKQPKEICVRFILFERVKMVFLKKSGERTMKRPQKRTNLYISRILCAHVLVAQYYAIVLSLHCEFPVSKSKKKKKYERMNQKKKTRAKP